MRPFDYHRALDADDALRTLSAALAEGRDARFVAGGTNLVDLMKEDVARPTLLVDIQRIGHDRIHLDTDGALVLGALARNAETAAHPLVRSHAPLLAAALLAGASPQIRNTASNGGNLLQRTRCFYFYDTGTACNKRAPGSGCAARGDMLTRQHAILGTSPACIATHPSDFCVALAALGAEVHVASSTGNRVVAFEDFHRLPGDTPQYDTVLQPDELITHLRIPKAERFAARSAYIKVRDRASYAFALVSVAAAVDLGDDGRIREARIALGGVAHKPWRVRAAEAALQGRQPDRDAFATCAQQLLEGAAPHGANAFKVTLAARVVERALAQAVVHGTRIDTAGWSVA